MGDPLGLIVGEYDIRRGNEVSRLLLYRDVADDAIKGVELAVVPGTDPVSHVQYPHGDFSHRADGTVTWKRRGLAMTYCADLDAAGRLSKGTSRVASFVDADRSTVEFIYRGSLPQ